MSIPSVPEDADGEAAINILAECVNNMMRAVGLDHAKTLSHHAATRDHEDVPSRTIKEGVLEGMITITAPLLLLDIPLKL